MPNYLSRMPQARTADPVQRAQAAAFGARAFLVAAPGMAHAPAWLAGEPLQQMRVVFVFAGGRSGLHERDRLLPVPPLLAAPGPQAATRTVRGEVLRGANGALYERAGQAVRRIERLMAAPDGALLDVASAEDSASPAAEAQTANASGAILPGAGVRRVVRLGEFKAMLTPQLSDPGRLRDNHQVAVNLQVYETDAGVPHGDDKALARWTPVLSRRFRLRLPPSRGPRFFGLEVAIDPTAADEGPRPGGRQGTPTAARSSIPDRFLNPWELRLTREEAVYDMQQSSEHGVWRSFVRRLTRRVSQADFDKWRALLQGKSLDAQLWAVPLPRHGLADARVRSWAQSTLREAGYDSGAMLAEWEIYWRRKKAG